MRIAVIETGTTRDALHDRFGNYPGMLIDLVASGMPGASFTAVSVVNGEPVPAAADFDGYVIMGSRHSVHDDLPWIEPLKNLVRTCADRRIPQVGICFGHQLIAEALGGRVGPSPGGWIAGLAHYDVIDPDNAVTLCTIASIAYHQEQVTTPPPGARTLLTAADCPYAGLAYDERRIFSVQSHPEFTNDYVSALIRHTIGDPLTEDVANAALASLSEPADRERLAVAIRASLAGESSDGVLARLAPR